MLSFYNPWWLLGLLLVPLYILFETKVLQKKRFRLPFSRFDLLYRISKGSKIWNYLYICLRALIIVFLVVALARPRFGKGRQEIQGEGVDIVIALDISGSMLAVDFVPVNRLGAAKKVAKDFIQKREHDRIGLVTFSEYALTRCPITMDHNSLIKLLDKVEVNKDASSTAIGLGLATSVARLRNSKAKSKVIILITDGVNNTGEIDPFAAAEMAQTFGIKVYPVGVGSNGYVDFPFDDPLRGTVYQKVLIEMDMETLNRIASITGTGEAALATNTEQLANVLKKIDSLEKSMYTIRQYYDYREMFPLFLWFAFLLLVIEILLKYVFILILPE